MKTLRVRTLDQWRDWLTGHHASASEAWLIYFKQHTDVESIKHKDALDEALCFGWVDSLVKRLDDRRYAVKFAAPTAAAERVGKKSKGFTDAEQAAMKERAQQLKAEARASKNKADGERAVLAKIAEMPEPDRTLGERLMPSSEPMRPTSCRNCGTGCPPMPTRTARSSASSKPRRSSRPDITGSGVVLTVEAHAA